METASAEAVPMGLAPASKTTESAAVNSPKKTFYHPELDQLRCFAFLCVYVVHTIHVPPARMTGFAISLLRHFLDELSYAVPLFFFLSSFLISRLLQEELESKGTISLGKFYLRRILRIWPLFFVYAAFAIAVGVAFGAKYPVELSLAHGVIPYFLAFSGNWYLVKHGFAGAGMLAILWSVCIEEQFYAVVPVVAKLLSRRSLNAVLWMLCVLSWGLGYYWSLAPSDTFQLFANTWIHVQFFAAGGLAAWYLRHDDWEPSLGRRLILAVAGFAIWMLGSVIRNATLPGHQHIRGFEYPVILVGVLLIFLSSWRLPLQFTAPFLVKVGKLTYGLYLLHPAVLFLLTLALFHETGHTPLGAMLAKFVVGLVCCYFVASASYKFLEAPFLRLKNRFTLVKSRPV